MKSLRDACGIVGVWILILSFQTGCVLFGFFAKVVPHVRAMYFACGLMALLALMVLKKTSD
jgi:hypothetical protein